MYFNDVAIPAGYAWSSPFMRWQGALADVSSTDLAAAVTRRALVDRGLADGAIDGLVLGLTIPQPEVFYGAPTLAGHLGLPGISGPMVSQACATSVAALGLAAAAVAADQSTQLVVTTDRTSNGPLLIYPSSRSTGGAPSTTHWVLDSFARDPWAGGSMLEAAETVAAKHGITRQETDDLAVLRHQQYADTADRPYLIPIEVHGTVVDADQGVRPVLPDVAGKLRTVQPDGIHTFATQTHPADGCAGAIVTTADRARELAVGEGIVRLLATGTARVAKSHMPEAPVPAARAALAAAGLDIGDVDAITTHNPFAVNDIYFARELDVPLARMNAYGCSLVFGHPQAPTGLRSITELIEELRRRGGGVGLFTGCAAGDTGAALLVRVED